MKNFCMYLPPYAPDYSGVCSALFDLNSLIVIHDAAGCTGNYTGFDEPRWYGSQKGVYCSGLRKIDVVMGNEYKFVDRIAAAAEQLKPELIAVVGSPVPMVIGTDFAGLCMDVEAATGIPSFGFAANGTNLYNMGVADASIAMIKKYTKKPAQRRERTVNILGATPLDINQRSMDSLTAWLEDAGYIIGARFSMGLTLGQVETAAESSLNLAISQAGVLVARYLEERFGMPYVAGLPIGEKGAAQLLRRMEGAPRQAWMPEQGQPCTAVVGDSVLAHAVGDALAADYGIQNITAASPFTGKGDPYGEDTVLLDCEQEVIDFVNSGRYASVIADPMINELIEAQDDIRYIGLAQYAISSKLYADSTGDYISSSFNQLYEREVGQ